MNLSPGRELVFEAFFTYDLAPFEAACFTCAGLNCIFFFFPIKIICREVLFCFGSPLLLMDGEVGVTVVGGVGASTGTTYCESMLDV